MTATRVGSAPLALQAARSEDMTYRTQLNYNRCVNGPKSVISMLSVIH